MAGGGGLTKSSGAGLGALLGDRGAFGPKTKKRQSTVVDMTAMIDLVFMMNIFFMVTSLVTAMAEMDLPNAQHVAAVDPDDSLVLMILSDGKGGSKVYLGEDAETPLPEAGQEERIAAAVADSVRLGRTNLLFKGDKSLTMSDIGRVGAAAGSVEGVKPYYAVTETNE